MKNMIRILGTRGTIFQNKGIYRLPEEIKNYNIDYIDEYSGANLSIKTVNKIIHKIKKSREDKILIISGTDSFEELSFLLFLLFPEKNIVLTGAAKPQHIKGYDGIVNIRESIKFLNNNEDKGVSIVINSKIFKMRDFYKKTSDATFYSSNKNFENIKYYKIKELNIKNILIINSSLWESYDCIDFLKLDGIIVSGAGTSSLSNKTINFFQKEIKKYKIPVVLCSRTPVGDNYNEEYYPGTLKKYKNAGFLIEDYKQLNAIQCKIKLLLELNC